MTTLRIFAKIKSILLHDIFITSFFGKIVVIYLKILFYIRSLFILVNNDFFYIIISLICLLKLILPELFSYGQLVYFWLYLGIQLMLYDEILSKISEIIHNNSNSLLAVTLLTPTTSNNILVRHGSGQVILGTILGKTSMTSTGRAAITVGVISGIGYVITEAAKLASIERMEASKLASTERIEATKLESTERIEAAKIAVERDKIAVERDKIAIERDKFAFEQHRHAAQMAATKRSGWGWFFGKK